MSFPAELIVSLFSCFTYIPEFQKIAVATAIGFAIMGFIGFFVKLIHIPINNIIVYVYGLHCAQCSEWSYSLDNGLLSYPIDQQQIFCMSLIFVHIRIDTSVMDIHCVVLLCLNLTFKDSKGTAQIVRTA